MTSTDRPWVIYLRLSDFRGDDDPGTFSAREQRLRAEVARLGGTVARVATENDLSPAANGRRRTASAFKRRKIVTPSGRTELRVVRPVFRGVLADITARRANLICEDLDRATRDPRDMEDLIDACAASSGSARSLSGSLTLTNGGTDAEIMIARVLVANAAKSSADTARRVKDARDRKAAAGDYGGGRRPFGYESDGVTVRESEAAEIVKAADAILAGVSLRAVTASLRERKVPTVTGAPWTTRTVSDILRRPRNAAILTHHGAEAGPASWPAVLDEPTWRAVTARLSDAGRRTSPGNAPRWLLSLIARCGICGGTVAAGAGRAQQPRYVCREHSHLSRVARLCDQLVTKLIIARLQLPDAAGLLAPRTSHAGAAALAREAAQLRASITEAGDMWEAGELTRADHRARTGRLRAKLDAAEAALVAAVPADPLAGLAGNPAAQQVWDAMDIGRRRAIVALLVTVTLLPTRHRGRLPDGTYFNPDTVQIIWNDDAKSR